MYFTLVLAHCTHSHTQTQITKPVEFQVFLRMRLPITAFVGGGASFYRSCDGLFCIFSYFSLCLCSFSFLSLPLCVFWEGIPVDSVHVLLCFPSMRPLVPFSRCDGLSATIFLCLMRVPLPLFIFLRVLAVGNFLKLCHLTFEHEP